MKTNLRLLVSYVIVYEDDNELYVFNEIMPYNGAITEPLSPNVTVINALREAVMEQVKQAVSVDILSFRIMSSKASIK